MLVVRLEDEELLHAGISPCELAASFNQMPADIAHHLRNPLTVIGGCLESLKDGKLTATPERFATVQAGVQHLRHLVEDLGRLSLADAGELVLHIQTVSPNRLWNCTGALIAPKVMRWEVSSRFLYRSILNQKFTV